MTDLKVCTCNSGTEGPWGCYLLTLVLALYQALSRLVVEIIKIEICTKWSKSGHIISSPGTIII